MGAYIPHTENNMFIIMWGNDHYDTNGKMNLVNNSTFDMLSGISNNSSVSSLFGTGTTYYAHRLPTWPESIQDGYSASWAQQDVLGRTSPLASYNSTGFRTVSFNLQFHREMVFDDGAYQTVKNMSTVNKNKATMHISEIEEILTALKLACYPVYASNGLLSPTIFFRFGQFSCKGYLESVSFEWKPPIIDDKYMLCDVSIGPINCSPKSVSEGSANKLLTGGSSMDPFGNSNDSGSLGFIQQGGR